MLKLYISKLPPKTLEDPEAVFYWKPKEKVPLDANAAWFLIQPVGLNTLASMVKNMCFHIGVTGKTNHSYAQQELPGYSRPMYLKNSFKRGLGTKAQMLFEDMSALLFFNRKLCRQSFVHQTPHPFRQLLSNQHQISQHPVSYDLLTLSSHLVCPFFKTATTA